MELTERASIDISSSMKKKLFTLLIFILVIFPFYSKASGGDSAGGRGGGTGILCDGEKLILAEEYELKLEKIKNKIPKSRSAVRRFMKKQFYKYPEFFQQWEKIWKANGSYKTWEIKNYKQYQQHVLNEASRVFGGDLSKSTFLLEHDDLLQLPKNCKRKQISYFFNDKIKKYNNLPRLSRVSKRSLELHESLFILGISIYEHLFPLKTRELVKALSKSKSEFEKAIQVFTQRKNEEDQLINSFTGVYGANPDENILNGKCPWTIVYLAESKERISEIALYIKNASKEVSKVEEKYYIHLPIQIAQGVNEKHITLSLDHQESRVEFHRETKDTLVYYPNNSTIVCPMRSLKSQNGEELPLKEKIKHAKVAQQMYKGLGGQ